MTLNLNGFSPIKIYTMKEKGKHNDLQTRREFFKKATKSVLPFLSAICIINTPFIAQAKKIAMGCDYSCEGSCEDSCMESCKTGCYDACGNNCYGTCVTHCNGSCYDSCQGGCSSCSGSCTSLYRGLRARRLHTGRRCG